MASVGSGSSGSTILWEDDGPDRIRGYMPEPKTTLFIIERHPTKPYRGRMTGAVIPDEDEKPDGILGNALISWLQGFAAPMYLREFEDRLIERRSSSNAEVRHARASADAAPSVGPSHENP